MIVHVFEHDATFVLWTTGHQCVVPWSPLVWVGGSSIGDTSSFLWTSRPSLHVAIPLKKGTKVF